MVSSPSVCSRITRAQAIARAATSNSPEWKATRPRPHQATAVSGWLAGNLLECWRAHQRSRAASPSSWSAEWSEASSYKKKMLTSAGREAKSSLPSPIASAKSTLGSYRPFTWLSLLARPGKSPSCALALASAVWAPWPLPCWVGAAPLPMLPMLPVLPMLTMLPRASRPRRFRSEGRMVLSDAQSGGGLPAAGTAAGVSAGTGVSPHGDRVTTRGCTSAHATGTSRSVLIAAQRARARISSAAAASQRRSRREVIAASTSVETSSLSGQGGARRGSSISAMRRAQPAAGAARLPASRAFRSRWAWKSSNCAQRLCPRCSSSRAASAETGRFA
mmetsp:Transcript_112137/g.317627  ORF Transcript_112137/g.317627 Transcript_112137/m.317627 type:complete len:333 (+) Transcript_112137:603-1601(+)